jgi:1,4-dihydroxy-2-naphthoate polyprenyltransferase
VAVAFATIVLIVLSGVKVIDDAKDIDYDRLIRKQTVAVVLGADRAHTVTYLFMSVGLLTVIGFAVVNIFPPSTVFAVLLSGGVTLSARRADPKLATMLLIRG